MSPVLVLYIIRGSEGCLIFGSVTVCVFQSTFSGNVLYFL